MHSRAIFRVRDCGLICCQSTFDRQGYVFLRFKLGGVN